jgi:membrane protein implicated in regulation of membrane protease activity
MSWTNVYLVCFLLGFSLSAVSWLLTMAGLHLPHVHGAHGVHAHGHVAHHHGGSGHSGQAQAAAAPSPINVSTAMAFLAWFGGAGYLLTRYSDVWPLAALLVAASVGWVGAALVFWFMAKVVWSPNENLDPDDFDIVGLLGIVSSPIRAGGTGEILFQQAGTRRVTGARSEHGDAIAKGIEVVITRYENGLAYVKTWTEMAGDTPAEAGGYTDRRPST